MQEEEKRKTFNPARDYIPNGKAAEFIAMVGADKHLVNMFIAANGVGKSASGANILTNIVFGPQSDWFQHPLFQKWPYLKRARIISDPTTIKEKIIPEIQKWFPTNESAKLPIANFEMGKEGKNYVCKITTNTGWVIDLMSTEQDAKEFESADIGFVWIDEPMPKDKFNATLARGRMGIIIVWTFTPLTFSAWIKNWMDEHPDDMDHVEAEAEDNCKIHGVRGILEHTNIKRMMDAMPEDEREARVFGKFGHLIGRVHKLFRRKIHVIRPFPLDPKSYTTYMALDPHPRTPDHVLYISVNSKGTKYITGEIVHQGSVKELFERMKAFETTMNYRIEGRIIDPSAYNDDQHRKDPSVGSQFFDLGMHFVKGSKDLMAGIKRTDDALNYEMKDGLMIRPPELLYFSTCPVTIKQTEEYVWQEWKGTAKDEKKANPRPKDINDHQVENKHRILLSEPVFVPYSMRYDSGYVGKTLAEEEESLDPYAK